MTRVHFCSVAVLLDHFISETAREKEAARAVEQDAHRVKDTVVNVLDPLLCILANEYVDDTHLCNILRKLFSVLSKGKEWLDPLDLCTAFTGMDVSPKIHFTRLDYDLLFQNSCLAFEGGVGAEEFELVMQEQVRGYIQRKLQRSVSEASDAKEQSEFSRLASIKALLKDVASVKGDLQQLHEVMRILSVSFFQARYCAQRPLYWS